MKHNQKILDRITQLNQDIYQLINQRPMDPQMGEDILEKHLDVFKDCHNTPEAITLLIHMLAGLYSARVYDIQHIMGILGATGDYDANKATQTRN